MRALSDASKFVSERPYLQGSVDSELGRTAEHLQDALAALAELERERDELRETVRRLNRRAQALEAGIAEKIASHPPGSMGRALANAAAEMYHSRAQKAETERDELRAKLDSGGVMLFGGQPTPWSDEQIDGLRCRAVAQMLIEEIGADGPESAEDAAKHAVTVIQHLRQRIAALEAEKAEREAQEPVAWAWDDALGCMHVHCGSRRPVWVDGECSDAKRAETSLRPLYAAPPIPRVEQEPVAWVVGIDELAAKIASELARLDGFDPSDEHCGLYDLGWQGNPPTRSAR